MSYFQLGPGPLIPEFEQVKSDIGIVENGNGAEHSIPSGSYVIWKGALYVATTDIPVGTTLSAESGGNLTAKTQGLGAEVSKLNDKLDNSDIYLENVRHGKYNSLPLYERLFVISAGSPAKDADTIVATPSGFPAYNKILHCNVSFYVNGNMVEAGTKYMRVYIDSSNQIHVIQSLGALSSLIIRLYVYFVL